MKDRLTKHLLGILVICLVFLCGVVTHEIWAKHRYEEWVKKEVDLTQRVEDMFDRKYRTDSEIEIEIRKKGNKFSWFSK